jgi:protein with PEP-CTERM/exosortase system signal
MKISKFLWSVLVVFATVAFISPQQVEAIIVDGRVGGQVVLTGSGTITESSGISSSGISSNGNGSGINELDFNGQLFPHGPLSVTGATDDFAPVMGSQATFNLAIRWTGSGSSVTLLDVLPGMGGPAWNAPIPGANGFATGTFFTLKSATFDEDSLTLIGMGTTQLISGDPLVLKHSPASIVIQGTGQDFTYDLTVVTTAVPDGGSGLGLLAIGLVAVEGLRRKIAARQNRYA